MKELDDCSTPHLNAKTRLLDIWLIYNRHIKIGLDGRLVFVFQLNYIQLYRQHTTTISTYAYHNTYYNYM